MSSSQMQPPPQGTSGYSQEANTAFDRDVESHNRPRAYSGSSFVEDFTDKQTTGSPRNPFRRTFSQLEAAEEPRRRRRSFASILRRDPDERTLNGSRRPSITSRSSSTGSMQGKGSGGASLCSRRSYRERLQQLRNRSRDKLARSEEAEEKQEFVVWLAKALLSFGAPSHRIESQLDAAAELLQLNVGFVHLPNLVIITFLDSGTHTYKTRFVRASGRVALSALHKVHLLYRDVLREKITAVVGTRKLKRILRSKPIYSIGTRCFLAFVCASIICSTAFGGAITDMFISGASASILQFLGLRAAAKSSIYANVYEISVTIVVSFIARALGTLRSNLFCFSAISSAGVVLILPGFTVLISALELSSRNIMCGSVRMVYAVIYTLFLGFGLTIGSDLYLIINKHARRNMALSTLEESTLVHGSLLVSNSSDFNILTGSFALLDTTGKNSHIFKGCYRNPEWPWFRQPLPWWSLFFLVPVYSVCSSLANLQAWRSPQLPVMVLFSCLAYAANKGANELVSGRGDIVSAFGALVIGLCGNIYSRIVRGTAFTAMVTGVLFLVPSAIGNGGGLIQEYQTSSQEYSSGFYLGIRMIQVAIGVTLGLFVSQLMVYALGRRKNAAHFAF
ncbi:ThrE exporter family protein [Abortiporus biennis]